MGALKNLQRKRNAVGHTQPQDTQSLFSPCASTLAHAADPNRVNTLFGRAASTKGSMLYMVSRVRRSRYDDKCPLSAVRYCLISC